MNCLLNAAAGRATGVNSPAVLCRQSLLPLAHRSDPMSYAYEQNSFIPADRALSMGRLLVPVIVLVIPAVGVLIGWVTYEVIN